MVFQQGLGAFQKQRALCGFPPTLKAWCGDTRAAGAERVQARWRCVDQGDGISWLHTALLSSAAVKSGCKRVLSSPAPSTAPTQGPWQPACAFPASSSPACKYNPLHLGLGFVAEAFLLLPAWPREGWVTPGCSEVWAGSGYPQVQGKKRIRMHHSFWVRD